MSLLGIDIGTTGAKTLLLNEEGRVLHQNGAEYPEIYPHPGWIEIDPMRLWETLKGLITDAASHSAADPIRALSFSVLGEAVTPVDRAGQPLANSITAADVRGVEEARGLGEMLGKDAIFRKTGLHLHAAASLCKILWFRNHHLDIYRNADKFLLTEDYLIARLGAPPAIDYALASTTMMLDVARRDWSDEILNQVGLDRSRLARVVPSGMAVGEVAPAIAAELGLPKGVLIVTGGHDQPVAALGAGLTREGMATDSIGTVECITTAFNTFPRGKALAQSNYAVLYHCYQQMLVILAYHYCAGDLLKWYRRNFGQEEMAEAERKGLNVYDVMIDQTDNDPADILVLPHFSGSGTPYLDTLSRGAIVGLTLASGKKEIVKGILDSIIYEIRLNVELLEHCGITIDRLRSFGGGVKNAKNLQLRADILGKEVTALEISEAGCLGAALLAGFGCGLFEDLDACARQWVREKQVYEPNLRMKPRYDEKFALYKQLYDALAGLHHRMGGADD